MVKACQGPLGGRSFYVFFFSFLLRLLDLFYSFASVCRRLSVCTHVCVDVHICAFEEARKGYFSELESQALEEC